MNLINVVTRHLNTIISCIDKTRYYNSSSKQAKEMNKVVAFFLAKDVQPYHTVERQGFKDVQSYHTVERQGFKSMVSKLNPKYNLPSCKHFCEKEIPSLYTSVKSDISSELEMMTFYSATTDLWTSKATHPYLSYTIHFVNENWELQSFCLETVPLLMITQVIISWHLSMTS